MLSSEHPPKPRLTLRLGITGKRRIPEAEAARIRAALSAVFDAFAGFLADCHARNRTYFSDEPPRLRITTGMAEGADQIAAFVAYDRYQAEASSEFRSTETSVAAILPFALGEFEKDLRNDPNRPQESQIRSEEEWRQASQQLRMVLNSGVVEAVLEIDDEALLQAGRPEYRDQAYPNLGDVLLDHSDILIAVSDDIYGGAGGTVDVMRSAARQGIPVVKVFVQQPKICSMRSAALDDPDQALREDEAFRSDGVLPDKLVGALDRILTAPSVADLGTNNDDYGEVRQARERLDRFFGEVFTTAYFDRIYKSFREALAVRPAVLIWFNALSAFAEAWWSYPRRLVTLEQNVGQLWPQYYDTFSRDGVSKAREILAVRCGWADVLAVRYADAARSAQIAIAVFGALAGLIAVIALVLPQVPDELALWIKIYTLSLEVAVLLIVGRIFYRSVYDQRWHERMVEYRAVAELLRHARFIYMLGAADRIERHAVQSSSEPDAWVGWYVRATLRELGFPTKVLSAQSRRAVLAAFLRNELQGDYGQIAYNKLLAERFNTIDLRLAFIVRNAFWLTIYAVIASIVLLTSIALFVAYYDGPDKEFTYQLYHLAAYIKPWLTIIAAFFPTLIAAIIAIQFQIDFRRTAARANATYRALAEISHALERTEIMRTGRKSSLYYVRAANEAMSADLAGWSSVYRGKGPELG